MLVLSPLLIQDLTTANQSYKRLRRHVTHNHLVPDPVHRTRFLYYVDGAWTINVVELSPSGRAVCHTAVTAAELAPVGNVAALGALREHPSFTWAAPDLMVVTNGVGDLAVLHWVPDRSATAALPYPRRVGPAVPPFTVLAAALEAPAGPLVVCTSSAVDRPGADGGRPTTEFLVQLWQAMPGVADSWQLRWQVTTADAPISAALPTGPLGVVTLAGTAGFVSEQAAAPTLQSTAESAADGQAAAAAAETMPVVPPYSWTQGDTDLTVYLRLPTAVDKRTIHVRFTHSAIKIMINGGAVSTPFDNVELLGKCVVLWMALIRPVLSGLITARRSWPAWWAASILPSSCYWTLEQGCLLTLYLEKADQSRWTHVMALDDNVDETIDQSVIAQLAEAWAHRTSSEQAQYRTWPTSPFGRPSAGYADPYHNSLP